MSQTIWKAELDNTYDCVVTRTSEREGRYVITCKVTGKVFYDKPVSLSYGALFGPDASDVGEWKFIAIEVIDSTPQHEKP